MRSADACPGVLRPHRAEDGAMVRLRLPGGRIAAQVLLRLVELANAYGNGIVQLTSRAGLQLRGLPDPLPTAFVEAITTTGLLPSVTHERVRNIVASPLTGLHGGLADVSELTRALDLGLMNSPELAGLPGRFLFVLDDGRGDVIDLRFDLGYQATGPGGGYVLAGSPARGIAVETPEVVPTLLRMTRSFIEARAASGAWHTSELPGWPGDARFGPVPTVSSHVGVSLGRFGDVASVSVPLARLTAVQAHTVAAIATGPVVVTPWRGLVIPGAVAELDALAATGLTVDEDAAWAQLSACVGLPACAKSRIDTAEVAKALVSVGHPLPRTHIAGCVRRCGAPVEEYLDLVAPTVAGALTAVDQALPVIGGQR
ncbi:MAG: nitrite reductase [Microlunatus sp.]